MDKVAVVERVVGVVTDGFTELVVAVACAVFEFTDVVLGLDNVGDDVLTDKFTPTGTGVVTEAAGFA